MKIFTIQRRVEYADTDMAGIVHFTAFFKYMESTEHALFRGFGCSINMPEADAIIGWPRRSCAFDFRGPLRFEDEFEIQLAVLRIGGRAVTYRADVVRDGELLARGTSTSVCCRIRPGSREAPVAIPIPETLRAQLTEYLVFEKEEEASHG